MSLEEIYEKAKATLIDKAGNPTPAYQAYMKYEDEWRKKITAYDTEYASALANPLKLQQWPNQGKLYQHEAEEASNRWIALGFKNEIENAVTILAAQPKDPAIADIMRKVQNEKNNFKKE